MNLSMISLELCVVGLGLVVLLADLWLPPERKRLLGYAAAAGLAVLLFVNLSGYGNCSVTGTAFGDMFIQDALSIFFKRFFLLAAILVLLIAVEFSDRIAAGASEYYSLILFALSACCSRRRPTTSRFCSSRSNSSRSRSTCSPVFNARGWRRWKQA
jgi:NADH-quinone oxidoreductase subunit N